MNPEPRKLNQISTQWTAWYEAHQGTADVRQHAQEQLLARYEGALRRYLRKMLRSEEVAEEVFQEFALRLVSGGLKGADPQRGRLRDFLKGVLFHLAADYHKRQKRQRLSWLIFRSEPAVEPPSLCNSDHEFLISWKEELLARSWDALAALEWQTGQPFCLVLRWRSDHPEASSPELAEDLTRRLGRPFSAVGARQLLHRARQKFADLLLQEVANSLTTSTADQIEQELIDLGLLEYCRPALERQAFRRQGLKKDSTGP
jgi:RNA polymerase sigma-70 factor (ECF subfamily)